MNLLLQSLQSSFSPKTIFKDLVSLTKFQGLFLTSMIVIMLSLSLYWNDNLIGIIAGITGVLCVFMVNMRKLSNFFWGFINCVLYGYVAYTANYYGDMMLSWGFYLPFQFIGVAMWYNSMHGDTEIVAKRIKGFKTILIMLIVGSIVTLGYSQLLEMMGGKLTIIDATTTVLGVIATFFMAKGYREQWICWIIVNIMSIYMWVISSMSTGDGYGVLIMWVMFLFNSIYGSYTWFKSCSDQENKQENKHDKQHTK